MIRLLVGSLGAATLFLAWPQGRPAEPQILEVRRIWHEGPHLAFTDLVRYRGRWYCTFRDASTHVSRDGSLRILTSLDGELWQEAAHLLLPGMDLRDPKFNIDPGDHLVLTAAAWKPDGDRGRHQTLQWVSGDGREWSRPVEIGEPDVWLWRIHWQNGIAYSMGYSTTEHRFLRLYAARDGERFISHADNAFTGGYPNETSIVFRRDGTALCLLRRDGESPTAMLGRSRPPYPGWIWQDLGVRVGGPHMIELPDGRLVAGSRLHDGGTRMSLSWVDEESGRLREFLKLPSGGDCGYPGLVYHDSVLWVSYYSSHEGKSSIYLAKVFLPRA